MKCGVSPAEGEYDACSSPHTWDKETWLQHYLEQQKALCHAKTI
jgi:hypothetical protein